jgi:hypothetical protein
MELTFVRSDEHVPVRKTTLGPLALRILWVDWSIQPTLPTTNSSLETALPICRLFTTFKDAIPQPLIIIQIISMLWPKGNCVFRDFGRGTFRKGHREDA